MGRILVGISAWTEKTLIATGWYPKEAHDAESRLRYYASRFPLVENDSTYYAIPAPHQAELWAERTPDGFTMDVKAFATLTDHYTDPRRLPKDLREALPVAMRKKKHVYPRDMPPEVEREIAARFRAALEPLHAKGRLGVVLFQLPVWLPSTRDAEARIVRAIDAVPDGAKVAVEFRNATWMSEKNRARTLAFLRDHGFAYTSVDEPQGFPSSVPPIAEATTDVAVVRFHGRSKERWAAKTEAASDRFRYLYGENELREWVPKVKALAKKARTVHVVMNNCWRDCAVVNAEQMSALLAEEARAAS